MAQVTPNLTLTVWNNLSDPYDSSQLVDNFVKIDLHDHSSGKGVQIDGSTGIKSTSISAGLMGENSVGSDALYKHVSNDSVRAVTTDHIKDAAVTTDKLANSTSTSTGVTTAKIADTAVTNAKLSSQISNTIFSAKNTSIPSGSFSDGERMTLPVTKIANASTDLTSNGGRWEFRWNSTLSVWEFIGGPPAEWTATSLPQGGTDNINQNTNTSTYKEIYTAYSAPNGATPITIPLTYKGVFFVQSSLDFYVQANTTTANNQLIALGGTAAIGRDASNIYDTSTSWVPAFVNSNSKTLSAELNVSLATTVTATTTGLSAKLYHKPRGTASGYDIQTNYTQAFGAKIVVTPIYIYA